MTHFYSRKLGNGKFRHEGNYHSISFAIDSITEKSEEQIESFLDSCSVKYLVNNEGYIIDIE
jgi:hypothetical protein